MKPQDRVLITNGLQSGKCAIVTEVQKHSGLVIIVIEGTEELRGYFPDELEQISEQDSVSEAETAAL